MFMRMNFCKVLRCTWWVVKNPGYLEKEGF